MNTLFKEMDKLCEDLSIPMSNTSAAIKKSLDHANEVNPSWSDIALKALQRYAEGVEDFITEEARRWLKGVVPDPPDNTAWGGVIVRAKNLGIIEPVEGKFRKTEDKVSHNRPCQVWRKKQYNHGSTSEE
jgi:hypothetical protein